MEQDDCPGRRLVVLSREREKFPQWAEGRFWEDPDVDLVFDRRVGERRRVPDVAGPERRRADRRARPDVATRLLSDGFAVVCLA